MAKTDLVFLIDNQVVKKKTASATIITGSSGGSGSPTDLTNYLKRDGTDFMLGNFDMGGFSISNVALLDGIDLPAHVGNADAHHARIHTLDSIDHTGNLPWSRINFSGSSLFDIQNRPHNALSGIGPNDHHAQIHGILSSNHTVSGSAFDIVGLLTSTTLGLFTPSSNPGATSRLLRTDDNGLLVIKRLEGTDYVKSSAYVQASSYISAGSYVSAVTYVDTPKVQATGPLTIQSTSGNIFLNTNTLISVIGNKALRSDGFVSGFLGNGWQFDVGVTGPGANGELDNLTVRGRMRIYELIIQRIRATNGSIFVTSVGKIASVVLESADNYLFTTEDIHGFFIQDLIRAQQFTGNTPNPLYRCDMRVTQVVDTKTFRAVRENGSDLPKVGMDFVRIGNTSNATRRGGLYLSSDDSAAPFMDVFDGVVSWGSWLTTTKTKVRIGKITGITGSADEYGIIAGNTGFGISNSWFKASNQGVVLNNAPLFFYSGSTWTGYWSSTGNEMWVGPNDTDKRLYWDGSILRIKGAITIEAGGNAATSTYVDSQASAAQSGAQAYTDGYAPNKALSNTSVNWAGSTTRGGSANDTLAVGGTAANTVRDGSARANLALNSVGRIVKSIQAPSITDNAVVTGLNLTSTHLGYYNGTYWTLFMKSDGTFRFGSTQTNNRIEWNGTELAGYNNLGAMQWYASAADGLIYAGAGAVMLGAFGLMSGKTLLNSSGLSISRPPTFDFSSEPLPPVLYVANPSAAQFLALKDESFALSEPYFDSTLNYSAQNVLKIFASSWHNTPQESGPLGATYNYNWKHYIDGVIEMPRLSYTQRTGGSGPVVDTYYQRLFVRNAYTSIVLWGGTDNSERIDINSSDLRINNVTTSLTSPAVTSSILISQTSTLATITASENLTITSSNDVINITSATVSIGKTTGTGIVTLYGVPTMMGYLRLRAATSNFMFIEFFARPATPSARSAWFGFNTNETSLNMVNELGSVIYFYASDRIIADPKIESYTFMLRQVTTAPAPLSARILIYMGTDGHLYARGANGLIRLNYTVVSGTWP